MIAVTIHGVLVAGLEGRVVPIEVQYEPLTNWHALDIQGCNEDQARATRVHVLAALDSIGHPLGGRVKVVVPKGLDGLDLPIALGCLIAMGVLDAAAIAPVVAFGDVSLMGALRPVRGATSRLEAIHASSRIALLPKANVSETFGGPYYAAADLADAVRHLAGGELPSWPDHDRSSSLPGNIPFGGLDFSDVHNNHHARRGLEIAAVGNHNVLMIGEPGAGKTMLARRMTTILPPMTPDERRDVTRIHSVAGILPESGVLHRPFRAPHHSVSEAGLLGGGAPPRPGEVTLAHHGVLLLDEVPEFRRSVLEGLASALRIKVTNTNLRACGNTVVPVRFPAAPLVLAAMNPCPGGCVLSRGPCTCPPHVAAYGHRLGAMLPLLPIRLRIPGLTFAEMQHAAANTGDSSATIQARVIAARAFGAARTGLPLDFSTWKRGCEGLAGPVVTIARTIADMDHSWPVLQKHGEEAEALVTAP